MAFSFENLKNNLEAAMKKTGEVAEKAYKKGSEVAEKAVKKGGEVANVAKLNLSLTDKKSKLTKLFTELGQLTYEKADAAEIAAKIVDIDDIKAAIEALKVEIAAANGKVFCKCGKEIEAEATFCKYCGAKVEKPEPKAEPEAKPEPKAADHEEADEKKIVDTKPLTTEEFVDTFESVMDKYGFKK